VQKKPHITTEKYFSETFKLYIPSNPKKQSFMAKYTDT